MPDFKIDFLRPEAIDFLGFEERNKLANIYRYSNYAVSFYRSDVLRHSRRVFWLLKNCLPRLCNALDDFGAKRAQVLSLVHDDVEILIGDFQSANRLKMNAEQLTENNRQEEEAIDRMAERFPEFLEGYRYRDLLWEIYQKNTAEAQAVKFIDHLDGFCEALHEIFAGNRCFTIPPETEYGTVPIPPDYYIPRFAQAEKHYPLLAPIL